MTKQQKAYMKDILSTVGKLTFSQKYKHMRYDRALKVLQQFNISLILKDKEDKEKK